MEIRLVKNNDQDIRQTISYIESVCKSNELHLSLANESIKNRLYQNETLDFSIWTSKSEKNLFVSGVIMDEKLPEDILSNTDYRYCIVLLEFRYLESFEYDITKKNIFCYDLMKINKFCFLEDLDNLLNYSQNEMLEIKIKNYSDWKLVKPCSDGYISSQ